MNHGRRSLLGMVMLGAMEPLFAAMPPASGGVASLDAELAVLLPLPTVRRVRDAR